MHFWNSPIGTWILCLLLLGGMVVLAGAVLTSFKSGKLSPLLWGRGGQSLPRAAQIAILAGYSALVAWGIVVVAVWLSALHQQA